MLLVLALAIGARPARDRASLQISVVAGVFDMGANVLYLLAVRGGMLSIVAVVASLYPASTVMLALIVDEERVSRWQAMGLVLAVLALVLVTLSR
jgi:drug/metabolite transporter (DMT)-like permease